MKTVVNRPNASAMLTSLRSIGYSFSTALADLIDNCIAADARVIDIRLRTSPLPSVAIIDDGHGMSHDELITAMRHGGEGPNRARRADDLGRFGLGLKTASLSQCRKLTVVTVHEGALCAAQWDVDQIERDNEWTLNLLSTDEIRALPHAHALMERPHGTIVLWENFDRCLAGSTSAVKSLEKLVDDSRDQLALVFHRFLEGGDTATPITITINGIPLAGIDPYLSSNRHTEKLPQETFFIEGQAVVVQPYVLPHLSNIKESEALSLGGKPGLRQNQGFYLYRNCRLITAGTWFRLIPQDQLTKLARVRIDIPNTLDHLWDLDVRKSSANPPEVVRVNLRRIIERIADRSHNVFRDRRRRKQGDVITHLWERQLVRGGVQYEINRDHPAIKQLSARLKGEERRALQRIIQMIELGLPVDSIYTDMASDRSLERPRDDVAAALREQAAALLENTRGNGAAKSKLMQLLPILEPFSMYPAVTRKLVEELQNVDG